MAKVREQRRSGQSQNSSQLRDVWQRIVRGLGLLPIGRKDHRAIFRVEG